MRAVLFAVVIGVAPAAAASQDMSPRTFSSEDARKFTEMSAIKENTEKERLEKLSTEELTAAITTGLSDVTKIIYQDGYGVYIEYTAADGRDRMWFPGNTGIVKGIWGVRDMNGGPRACFHYFNARNVVTGEFESTECVPPEQTLSGGNVIDQRAGDVFNLLSDRIPFRKNVNSIPAWPPAKDGRPAE